MVAVAVMIAEVVDLVAAQEPASSATKKATWHANAPTRIPDLLVNLWSATSVMRKVTWLVIALSSKVSPTSVNLKLTMEATHAQLQTMEQTQVQEVGVTTAVPTLIGTQAAELRQPDGVEIDMCPNHNLIISD